LAAWDQDGSALTDIIDPNEVCLPSQIKDDPEAISQQKQMRGQRESETVDEFGLC
jgi:hypothetical protein